MATRRDGQIICAMCFTAFFCASTLLPDFDYAKRTSVTSSVTSINAGRGLTADFLPRRYQQSIKLFDDLHVGLQSFEAQPFSFKSMCLYIVALLAQLSAFGGFCRSTSNRFQRSLLPQPNRHALNNDIIELPLRLCRRQHSRGKVARGNDRTLLHSSAAGDLERGTYHFLKEICPVRRWTDMRSVWQGDEAHHILSPMDGAQVVGSFYQR